MQEKQKSSNLGQIRHTFKIVKRKQNKNLQAIVNENKHNLPTDPFDFVGVFSGVVYSVFARLVVGGVDGYCMGDSVTFLQGVAGAVSGVISWGDSGIF